MADTNILSLDREHYGKEVARIQKMMADEKEMTNVILVCGEKKIPAHKVILAAASSYFRNMFRNDCKETLENIVEFPTVSESTLTIILDFIYSGGFKEICWQNVEETIGVLEAAHLFELKSLLNICCNQLVEKLTLENCLQLWKLSNLFEHEVFRRQTFQYIKNNLQELMKAEALLQMDETDFTLLLAQFKTGVPPQECFKNSVIDWILEDREERQSLISLLNVRTLPRKIIKTFLEEKKELSEETAEFLKQLSETDLRELDVPLSSLKMLLFGKVDDQLAYQIVDFSGRSSALKRLPLIGRFTKQITGAVYNTSFYFMTKEFTRNSPLYECCLLTKRILLWKFMEDMSEGEINQCFVVGDYLYVYGRIRDRYTYTWFLRCYDILKNTWCDSTHLIKDFQNITFEVEYTKSVILIDKSVFQIEDKNDSFALNYIVNNQLTNKKLSYFPLPLNFYIKSACCYKNSLFMFGDNRRAVIHNLVNRSSELISTPFETEKLLFFPGFHSLGVGVETNIASSEAENCWSHRLINLEDGQEISKILSTQINLAKYDTQVLFVSDTSF